MRTSLSVAEIARCNGVVLVADGDRVSVVEGGGGWMGTAVFVVALLALILEAAGLALIVQRQAAIGVGLLGAGGLAIGALVALVRWRARVRRAEPSGRTLLVFDLAARVLRDGRGRDLAPLDRVTVARTWQAGSSSKALTVRWDRASLVIARGTPFGDGVDAVEAALVGCGVRAG